MGDQSPREITSPLSRTADRLFTAAVGGAIVSALICLAFSAVTAGEEREPDRPEFLPLLGLAAAVYVLSVCVILRLDPTLTLTIGRKVHPVVGVAAAAVVLVPTLWTASVFLPTWAYRDSLRTVAADVKAACGGSAVPRAARYVGTNHPLVAVDLEFDGAAGRWTSRAMGQDWTPVTSEVQLVACLGEAADTEHGSCGPYEVVGTLPLLVQSRDVWIVEASTGRSLARQMFRGGTACPTEVVYTGGPLPVHLHGDSVDWDNAAIWGYIRSWISGPVAS